jgi:hypothetical protein
MMSFGARPPYRRSLDSSSGVAACEHADEARGVRIRVEPGIYLPAQGFGVRTEDEVLITDHGYRMLTSSIPRKLEEVEAWIARARQRAR